MSVAMKTTHKPAVCLCCDGEDFALVQSLVEQEFRGETLRVPAQVWRCQTKGCGQETLVRGQLDALRLATADAYRARHGLMTSGEIRALREQAGLSQRKFAEAVGVGPASIPRWESWQVQEPVYDEKLRAFAAGFAGDGTRTLTTLQVVGGFSRRLPLGEIAHAGADWWKLGRGTEAWVPDLGAHEGGSADHRGASAKTLVIS